jgi:multiple sugar transport system substrate-binding protein
MPVTGRPLSRRQLLRGAGALALGGAAASALSGCGTALGTGLVGAGDAADDLTYWNLFSGGDGTRMIQMEQGYQRHHRDISLDAVTLAWGNPYYTKLSLATRGGHPPDIAVSHLTRMQTLARAGLLTPFAPDDLARHGLTKDKFNSVAWRASHVDGKLYAVPLDSHPYVLYYNTKICKKAGLLDGDGKLKAPHGADELIAALRAIKKVTGSYGLVMATINDTSSCWRLFATLYWQQGAEVIADQGTRVVLDDDKAMRALDLIRRLSVEEELMPPSVDDNGTVVAFSGGQAGFLFDGEWDNTIYTTNHTPYDMTRFPQVFGDSYTVQADSHTFVLPDDPHRDRTRMDRSLAFIKSMLDQSLTWAKGGHIPAWEPTRTSSSYARLDPQSHYADVADFIHYDPLAWYSGSGSDLEIFMGSTVSAVLTGQISARQALRQMHSSLSRYATTPPPVS